MAPIRRYLRITKHSVLEVRIYLDRPADADSWLLKRANPALPRVIQAIQPLVLPKLREENERAKGKGKAKKKGVKDVLVEDDFEVSIFLTELSSRHSVLTKQKAFQEKPPIRSNSGKLTGWLMPDNEPIATIDKDSHQSIVIREEEDDEAIALVDIPEAIDEAQSASSTGNGLRRRRAQVSISDGSDDAFSPDKNISTRKKVRRHHERDVEEESEQGPDSDDHNDKKKLNMHTSYEGFSIYGRILCLVIKRKGERGSTSTSDASTNGQQMMETWVSTQAAAEQIVDDEHNG